MNDRFCLLRRLGAGGMGVVFEAYDREQEVVVAIKVLPALEPKALYLFKQEFRSFANITHPNLVALYELFAQGDSWFFTMERIDGMNFLEAAQSSILVSPSHSRVLEETATMPTRTLDLNTSTAEFVCGSRFVEYDADRLREFVRQAAEGIEAIHQAGKLHRDIKPSNVLVTKQDRVVILDFGLIAELRGSGSKDFQPGAIAGTVAYMSPEQGTGKEALTPASDWYQLGVMIFEAITGRLPFEGRADQVLKAKLAQSAPPVGSFIPNAPPDLARLCDALLERDPKARPNAAAIFSQLRGGVPIQAVRPRQAQVFVGRTDLIAQMHECFTRLPGMVFVHGPSGVGKSAMVEKFLEEIGHNGALVLRGHCYEQESVPFRAMDGVVDVLSRTLLERFNSKTSIPPGAGALAAAFPVLRNIPGFSAAVEGATADDPVSQRRQAFQAFRELLKRLSSITPVVIFIDDLQWGDADSAALISELMRPPGEPSVLLIATYRQGAELTSECIRTLLELCAKSGLTRTDLPLQPLSNHESRLLAEQLLGSEPEVEAVVRESGGSPFFIRELAKSAESGMGLEGMTSLDEMIWQRVSLIPENARSLLEVIAVAGHRVAEIDAYHAADLRTIHPGLARLLRNGNLVRGFRAGDFDEVETYHDRVRESIVARLPSERKRQVHERLALTLERAERGQPETLALHFEASGHAGKAIKYYVAGAEKASVAIAFDHAASLYEHAVALCGDPHEASVWRARMGDALANGGRSEAAAKAYSEAALSAPPELMHLLERQAAYHYCASGHIDKGKLVFEQVLARHGMSMPRNYGHVMTKIITDRLKSPFRRLRLRERSAVGISPALIERIDTALAVGAGLVMVDQTVAFTFNIEALRMALTAGDPFRLLRATIFYAPVHVTVDRPGAGYSQRLFNLAEALADHLGTPEARAFVSLGKSSRGLVHGCWDDCYSYAEEAERLFARCTGFTWELDTARSLILYALSSAGRYRELSERSAALLQQAEDRGNLFLATNIGTFNLPVAMLSRNQPEEARRMALDYRARWTSEGYHLQHVMTVHTLVWSDLYEDRASRAWQTIQTEWPEFRRHNMNYLPQLRIWWTHLRAHAALSWAVQNPAERAALLRIATADARRMERECYPWSHAMALLVRAGIYGVENRTDNAIQILDTAQRRFDDLGMQSCAAAARLRLASLVGGDRAKALRLRVDEWVQRENVTNASGLMAVFTPGFGN